MKQQTIKNILLVLGISLVSISAPRPISPREDLKTRMTAFLKKPLSVDEYKAHGAALKDVFRPEGAVADLASRMSELRAFCRRVPFELVAPGSVIYDHAKELLKETEALFGSHRVIVEGRDETVCLIAPDVRCLVVSVLEGEICSSEASEFNQGIEACKRAQRSHIAMLGVGGTCEAEEANSCVEKALDQVEIIMSSMCV